MLALFNSLFVDVQVEENGKLIINIIGNEAGFKKEIGEGEIENEGTRALISSLSPPFYGSSHSIDMNGEHYCLTLSLISPK